MSDERMEVHRLIAADPAVIFGLLSDPQGHVDIDSSGMLMDATGQPVSTQGDRFVVHMDREALNDYPMGRCDVTVEITKFEPIAKSPGRSRERFSHRSGTFTGTSSSPIMVAPW
jgi:hypothetical protein